MIVGFPQVSLSGSTIPELFSYSTKTFTLFFTGFFITFFLYMYYSMVCT